MSDWFTGTQRGDDEYSAKCARQNKTAKDNGFKSYHEMIRSDWFTENRDRLIKEGLLG
jgi:hypothetical protein